MTQQFYTIEILIGNEQDKFSDLKYNVLKLLENDSTTDLSNIESNEFNNPKYSTDTNVNIEYFFIQRFQKKLDEIFIEEFGIQYKNNDVTAKIIDYKEKKGSLTIILLIAVTAYKVVTEYGAFRQGIDYLADDIKKFFSPLNPTTEVNIETERTFINKTTRMPNVFFENLLYQNLFWNISGASINILEKSYTDHNKYKSLGAAILFTSIFAFISCFFALSYITHNLLIIIPIALLWALTILNIDMIIVNTMIKYDRTNFKIILGFISRLFLGVLIAISLSIPLEITLFNDEIKDEIDMYDNKIIEREIRLNDKNFTEIDSLKRESREMFFYLKDEMQGNKNASGRYGFNGVSKVLKAEKDSLNKKIERLEDEKSYSNELIRYKITKSQNNNNKYGFTALFRALCRLQDDSNDNSILKISIGIKLLLLLIELLPMISKILLPRGAYDSLYEYEEANKVHYNDMRRSRL